ncbi:tryptophan synthetase [Nowakowskiella sp. JEL0407]|nr:tryptophan synthetase [Nowakowskiella sp. JEL0407]
MGGFPKKDSTVEVLLGMQASGVDIIELGVPFTDPIADGPVIQDANWIALQNQVDLKDCLNYVQTARKQGLVVPVLLMQFIDFDHGEDMSDISTIPDDVIAQILKEGLETEVPEMEILNEISAENMAVAESFFKLYAAGVFDGMGFEERLRSI